MNFIISSAMSSLRRAPTVMPPAFSAILPSTLGINESTSPPLRPQVTAARRLARTVQTALRECTAKPQATRNASGQGDAGSDVHATDCEQRHSLANAPGALRGYDDDLKMSPDNSDSDEVRRPGSPFASISEHELKGITVAAARSDACGWAECRTAMPASGFRALDR